MGYYNDDVMLTDSLTADEIRRVLPEPTMVKQYEQEHEEENESEDEHKDHEVEEKAMEILQMQREMMRRDNMQQQPAESANQSMQIPQHSYDMELIPEYDPSKYSTNMHTVHVTRGGDNMIQEEEDDDDNEENENEITRTHQHYSSSYLDTYSTLMDIPQIMGDDNDNNDDEFAE